MRACVGVFVRLDVVVCWPSDPTGAPVVIAQAGLEGRGCRQQTRLPRTVPGLYLTSVDGVRRQRWTSVGHERGRRRPHPTTVPNSSASHSPGEVLADDDNP